MRPRALDWAGVALVSLCSALAGLVEVFLVPLYAGSVIVPVAVVLAVAGNVAFPRMARTLVPTTFASALPLLAWLVVAGGFGAVSRPEGDVILPSAPTAVELVTYGVLLGGAIAGTVSVIVSMPPPGGRTERLSR